MGRDLEEHQELKRLDEIDPFIHSPTRLKIMTCLYLVENIDFVYLKRVTSFSWGNLSKHLSKLEDAGYVAMEKTFENKKPKTLIWLTDTGREAFQEYKDNLQQMFDGLPD
jgi:DNA-binding MarR family transcriptional regulator